MRRAGHQTVIATCTGSWCRYTQNTWQKVEVEVARNRFRVILNDTVILQGRDDHFRDGSWGLYSSANNASYFSDVKLHPEPAGMV